MKELKDQVSKLSEEEWKRSMIKHPLFNSTHEGYAVIKEELEEAETELKDAKFNLSRMWDSIKDNNSKWAMHNATVLKEYAINLAAESIQVAAMAQKFIDSFKEETNE